MKYWLLCLLMVFVLASCSSTRKTLASGTEKPAAVSKDPRFLQHISVKTGTAASSPATPAPEPAQSLSGYSYSANKASSIEWMLPLQFKYAIIMNTEVEWLSNTPLFSFIDDWYGTRYRYGGTTKQGIDCSGFSGLLMSTVFGVSLSRTAREQYEQASKIRREDLREGDLVFFNTRGGVSHVGVYLRNNKFVHASTSAGVMISDLDEAYYHARFVSGGRVRE